MLLQNLFLEENKNLESCFQILINEESTNSQFSVLPTHIKELGFILTLEEDGTMNENLIDIIINYKLNNLNVIVEVPLNLIIENKTNAKYLMQLSSNIGFSLSILPPKHPINLPNNYSLKQYEEVLLNFLKEMESKPNYEQSVIPINSYFDYLMLEKILGKNIEKIFSPQDPYIINNYVLYLTHEESNKFKESIRENLYNYYGGEKNFNIMISAIIKNLYSKSKDMYSNYLKS